MLLQKLPLFMRFFLLEGIICIFAAIPGFAFYGWAGALLMAGLLWGVLFMIACLTEIILARFYQTKDTFSEGLIRLFQVVTQELQEKHPPRLSIFSHPVPQVLVVRSFAGKGRILFSWGVLSQFNEQEIKILLKRAILKLQQPEITFQSLCSILSLCLMKLAPSSGARLFFSIQPPIANKLILSHPFSMILLFMLYPAIQFLILLGQNISSSWTHPAAFLEIEIEEREIWIAALNKIKQATSSLYMPETYVLTPLLLVQPSSIGWFFKDSKDLDHFI